MRFPATTYGLAGALRYRLLHGAFTGFAPAF